MISQVDAKLREIVEESYADQVACCNRFVVSVFVIIVPHFSRKECKL
jgi:hypothetical protein